MSTSDDDVLVQLSLHGANDNSPLRRISDSSSHIYGIQKAGKVMAAAQREFYDAVNDKPKDPTDSDLNTTSYTAHRYLLQIKSLDQGCRRILHKKLM